MYVWLVEKQVLYEYADILNVCDTYSKAYYRMQKAKKNDPPNEDLFYYVIKMQVE